MLSALLSLLLAHLKSSRELLFIARIKYLKLETSQKRYVRTRGWGAVLGSAVLRDMTPPMRSELNKGLPAQDLYRVRARRSPRIPAESPHGTQ